MPGRERNNLLVELRDELTRLVARSGGRTGALVRGVCGQTLGLAPLPAAVDAATDAVVAEFAEQFSVDVSAISAAQRSRLWAALGDNTFGVVVQMYVADFMPRVRAGLRALDLPVPWPDTVAFDDGGDLSDAVFNVFLPAVARLRELDAVTSELVRLRGAAQHNCRLCKSLRERTALDAGGSESLYDQIGGFESSEVLSGRHKAALRYVDALIWSPARIEESVIAGVREHFSDLEALELILDVMRNASNKVAVALGADAPRVANGTEQYRLDASGQTVFG